jgi:hypothetical protein
VRKIQGFLLAVNTDMTTRILVTTKFDCTTTGITGNFKANMLPFRDKQAQLIHDQVTWTRSRNQQRNWETILQIIGLYTQAQDITHATHTPTGWQFEFTTEFDDVFNHSGDRLGLLKLACQGVPMFVNLDHVPDTAMLDPDVNIQFEIVDHK